MVKYIRILNILCNYYGIKSEKIDTILVNRENKFLILLIFKNYNCANKEILTKIMNEYSWRSISYNMKKAEEKFFINRDFREKYFEIENVVEKIL
ncbi:hypothetical protein [Clostridium fallax]|uniref:Uncharacterized protein n=1 Tax=Clostridium fallax TaxID=1533 RepID=A0A1M4WJ44_9CLOT|nr:hypothetical protein [Clostridium fallax]SHE81002.1 hypothetical protein SAMN05443638_11258 [Clostridium fallax]SQB05724.1 ribose 5-phosphate isomerase [Clostridium fallax]